MPLLHKLSPYFLVLALGSGCAAKHTVLTEPPVLHPDCRITQTSKEFEGEKKDKKIVAEHSRYIGWDKNCGSQREENLKHEFSFKLLVQAFSAPGIPPEKKSEIAQTILGYLGDKDSKFKEHLQKAMQEKNITVDDIAVSLISDPQELKKPATPSLSDYTCTVTGLKDGITTSHCILQQ